MFRCIERHISLRVLLLPCAIISASLGFHCEHNVTHNNSMHKESVQISSELLILIYVRNMEGCHAT